MTIKGRFSYQSERELQEIFPAKLFFLKMTKQFGQVIFGSGSYSNGISSETEIDG